MPSWNDDEELFRLVRERLYTPVIGDVLDQLGRYHQLLPPGIRPLDPGMVVAGRAMTVLMTDVFGPQDKPFGLLTEALDQLRPHEVYVASGGTGRCAYWGELLTATARVRGATGAVIDGWHRDTPQVLAQDFPVFSTGAWAQDSSVRTQVAAFRVPLEIGGVRVADGDLVVGDVDGVVVVPDELHVEVVERALEKASAEKVVRRAIEDGMTATEAFRVHGVL